MSTGQFKDRFHVEVSEVLDFQSHWMHAVAKPQAESFGIPTRIYIQLIELAQRAEKLWRETSAAVRREELGSLDIRDRSGAQVLSEDPSLLDLDRDFIASRLASLAAKEDLQARGAKELDAEAAITWDDIEATVSCVKDWGVFVGAVRAYGRLIATEK